jgi:hypothetical protein
MLLNKQSSLIPEEAAYFMFSTIRNWREGAGHRHCQTGFLGKKLE